MRTRKVLDIEDTMHYICIKHEDTNCNPYRLYRVWKDSGYKKRRQIAKYDDFESVLWHVLDIKRGYERG